MHRIKRPDGSSFLSTLYLSPFCPFPCSCIFSDSLYLMLFIYIPTNDKTLPFIYNQPVIQECEFVISLSKRQMSFILEISVFMFSAQMFFQNRILLFKMKGLFISRDFVEAHGGTLTVESEFGKGSRFVMRLKAW